jgi:hypothetical protein
VATESYTQHPASTINNTSQDYKAIFINYKTLLVTSIHSNSTVFLNNPLLITFIIANNIICNNNSPLTSKALAP